jgi:hypothetical protein
MFLESHMKYHGFVGLILDTAIVMPSREQWAVNRDLWDE